MSKLATTTLFSNENINNNFIRAAQIDDVVTMKTLLAKPNLNINYQDDEGNNALIWLVRNGNYEICKQLLELGTDVNIANNDGYTSLMFATLKGLVAIVNLLLAKMEVNLNIQNNIGNSALHFAAMGKYHLIMKWLLQSDADVNIVNNYGDTPLIVAVQNQNISIVQLLLAHGADVNITNKFEQTALTIVKKQKNEALLSVLTSVPFAAPVVNDINVNEVNENNNSNKELIPIINTENIITRL